MACFPKKNSQIIHLNQLFLKSIATLAFMHLFIILRSSNEIHLCLRLNAIVVYLSQHSKIHPKESHLNIAFHQ